MNYATERLLAAATESLNAWEGEEQSVREEHAEMIEELESALHYFAAHGEMAAEDRQLIIDALQVVSPDSAEGEERRIRLLDAIQGEPLSDSEVVPTGSSFDTPPRVFPNGDSITL